MKRVVAVLCGLIAGCAALPLTQQGAQVKLLLSGDQASKCKQIKMVSETIAGAHQTQDVNTLAMNDTAAAGGDALYIISMTTAPSDGSLVTSLNGMALLCKSDAQ